MVAEKNPVQARTGRSSTGARVLHLSAYVDLPILTVLSRFAGPQIDDVLASAVRAALERGDETSVRAHASAPVWVSANHVRVPVEWSATGPSGRTAEGTAMVSLLLVRSGRDAITELLVALPVSEEAVPSVTAMMHRVLDELTGRLESVTT